MTRAGILLGLAAALSLLPQTASAAPDRLSIGSLTLEVGDEGTVELRAGDIEEPSVRAWIVDIKYDPAVVELTACEAIEIDSEAQSLCHSDLAPEALRIIGISADGLPPESTLASMSFRCRRDSASELSIHIEIWADAMIVFPEPPSEVDIEEGTIACLAPPATPPLPALPSTGGAPSNSDVAPWLLAALGIVGLAAVSIALLGRRA